MKRSKSTVTIIGTGALGTALSRFFREYGYKVLSEWNSRGGTMYDSTGKSRSSESLFVEKETQVGDLIFITTSDDLIKTIAEKLSGTSVSWEDKIVVHCSGNLTSDELSPLAGEGARIISMHPIQSFKKGDGSERFKDIMISLEGDEVAMKRLKPIIHEMGAKPLKLEKKQKRYLHIAAVMASNYVVALMFGVENLLKDVNLDEGFESLETLVHQTVNNIFKKGPANSLSGPISRGDTESIQTHLDELDGREQEKLYRLLGKEALKIAQKEGKLSHSTIAQLYDLLEKKP